MLRRTCYRIALVPSTLKASPSLGDHRHDRYGRCGAALRDDYRWLARYNRWFNQRLMAACGSLSDAERKRDRGAFFGSIHGTFNHLMWADRMWLTRFVADTPFPALSPELLALPPGAVHATELYAGWAELTAQRDRLDAAIEDWTAQMPANFPLSTMHYANSKGVERNHPVWQALTHFFNHQTHHRGQITTLLMQSGVDVGLTDAIALAGR